MTQEPLEVGEAIQSILRRSKPIGSSVGDRPGSGFAGVGMRVQMLRPVAVSLCVRAVLSNVVIA